MVVNPALFELLENYYRPKRQLRATFAVGGLVLFALLMCWAASMWIGGIDEVPRYVCAPGDREYVECVARYKSRAGEFAESRALASLVPLAIGALFGAAWFPIRSRNSPALVRLFRERPVDGVWIYPLEIRTKKHGRVRYRQHRVVVATTQRKKLHIDVLESTLQPTMALFSAALPHATVGYTQQLDAQFNANPEALRRPVPPGHPQQQAMPPQYPQQGQYPQQPQYPHQQPLQQQYPQSPQYPPPPGWPPRR